MCTLNVSYNPKKYYTVTLSVLRNHLFNYAEKNNTVTSFLGPTRGLASGKPSGLVLYLSFALPFSHFLRYLQKVPKANPAHRELAFCFCMAK